MCDSCCVNFETAFHDKLATSGLSETETRDDGIAVCAGHKLEHCDICMVSFTLPNDVHRETQRLGRELTESERASIWNRDCPIVRDVCILDGQPMCKRTGKKLKCACRDVTYCSKECQHHHWKIHKMTCSARTPKKKATPQPPQEFEADSLSVLQELVTATSTPSGSIIRLCPGTVYGSSSESGTTTTPSALVITRAVTIEGTGMTDDGSGTIFNCAVVIQMNSPASGKSILTIRNCRCLHGLKMKQTSTMLFSKSKI